MARFESDNTEKNLSFEFVIECLDYALNKSDITLPHTGYCGDRIHNRENYRFNGYLYDWMVTTQPKMWKSLEMRKQFQPFEQ